MKVLTLPGRWAERVGSWMRSRRARNAVGLSALVIGLTTAAVAQAQLDGAQDALDAAGSSWNFGNTNGVRRPPLSLIPEGEADRSVSGFGLDDAALSPLGPAVDTSATLWINDLQFASDTFSTTNGVLTAGPVVTQGVSVTVQHSLVINAPVLRSLISFTNSSGSPVTLNEVEWIFSEVGGDENATRHTASGDAIFNVDDRWTISSDTDGTTPPTVPVVLYVLYGPGSPLETTASAAVRVYQVGAPSNFQRGMQAIFGPITVPAGTTRRLLFFTGLYQTNEHALAASAAFSQLTSCAFFGIPTDQYNQILNWTLSTGNPADECVRVNLTSLQR